MVTRCGGDLNVMTMCLYHSSRCDIVVTRCGGDWRRVTYSSKQGSLAHCTFGPFFAAVIFNTHFVVQIRSQKNNLEIPIGRCGPWKVRTCRNQPPTLLRISCSRAVKSKMRSDSSFGNVSLQLFSTDTFAPR